jgi:hypothetical protein
VHDICAEKHLNIKTFTSAVHRTIFQTHRVLDMYIQSYILEATAAQLAALTVRKLHVPDPTLPSGVA